VGGCRVYGRPLLPRQQDSTDASPAPRALVRVSKMVGMIDRSAPTFELSKYARRVGTERSLSRRHKTGDLVRVRQGVYIAAESWEALGPDARFRTAVYAAAEVVRPGTQFAGDSAAALLRIPTLGPWPTRVEVLGERASGGRSSSGVHRRSAPNDPAAIQLHGVTVTSLARTAVDIGAACGFLRAVCMIDDVLRKPHQGEFRDALGIATPPKELLFDVAASLAPFPGLVKASFAIGFADGASGSIGESLSRAQMHVLGLPAPLLQVPFYDADGLIGYADFYWPELGLIGEFDGRVKYNGRVYHRGQLPEEVVWAEKQREDRLRAVARDLVRWDWNVAFNAPLLAARLASHGLVPAR